MLTSPLLTTEDSCTEPYCRIQRAADTLLYYISGASASPWYLTPEHYVLATIEDEPYPVHSPLPKTPEHASQAILDAEYIAFAQPEILMALCQVLVERAETHKLQECYYCKTKHEDCPSLLLSDLILSMPLRIRELPPTIPCPTQEAK